MKPPSNKAEYSKLWKILYVMYPPLLRLLEKFGFHRGRQEYHVGYLRPNYTLKEIRNYLVRKGFENAILAWKDSDEVLSMRLVHNKIFQYHIRMYKDMEIRGHYEYSSEGSPLKHISGKYFLQEKEFFQSLLRRYLKT